MAKQKPTKMLAVLGRCRRTGRWRVAGRSSVLALLGTCNLDMRHSFVDGQHDRLRMKVTVVLGSATFLMPEGAEVRPSGLSLLSASSVDVPEHPEEAELPMLDIEWTSILGRLRIMTMVEPEVDGDEELPPPEVAKASEVADPAPAPTEPLAPPPGIGFEDLGKEKAAPPPGIGFEDLDKSRASKPPPGIGFEDLGEVKTRDKPSKSDSGAGRKPAPVGIGFEDL